MPNPNVHYKEINELLKKFDLEVQKVKEGLNKSPMYEFGIEFQKNEIGINKENIESILFALRKNEILIKSTPRVDNKGVVFSVVGINKELIFEIKSYFKFDLEQYEKSITQKEDLELDKLKYEKANQELDKEIKLLTEKNLRLQNLQIIYGLIGAVLGLVGAFLSEYWFGLIRILIKYLI